MADAAHGTVKVHDRLEGGRVRGSAGDHRVRRGAQSVGFGPLAQAGLGIDLVGLARGVGHVRAENLLDEVARDVIAALEVDRRDDGLEGVG